MKLPQHDRYDYSPIHKRPTYEWPNGTRLAFTICNNIEHFAFRAGLGSDSAVTGAPQSHRNYAWRDYGNRVGIWSYFDLLDGYGLPASHNINSAVLEACPDLVERLNARGDEYIGHGRSNAERQDGLWEEDEARLIAECTEVLTRLAGRKPLGWLGPWIAQSACTLDLLVEAGYRYVMDWPADDQPFWMRTRAGPILSVPYPIEINDSPALIARQHSAREFEAMIIDQFDELLRRSEKYPLVFSIALHPFIIGQPFRMQALRRALDHVLARRDGLWITVPGEIARFCETLAPGIVPGS
ncbi:MAG: polysaccharide deacetylase family protein [Acidisphaera sp.]|nr:polysaccharide deacetylase family protein [Acidisphaera sp.]